MQLRSAILWGAILAVVGGGPLFFSGCQTSALVSGKLYLKQQKFDQAREQLQLAARQEPDNAEAFYHLGRVCGLQGDYLDMAEAFDRSQALSREFDRQITDERLHYWSRIYNDGVRAAAGQGADLRTARRHFDTAVHVLPERLRAWRNRAALDYQLGDIDAAVAGYEHVLTQAPDDTSTALVLGIVLLGAQRWDEAAASFERVLAVGDHRGALVNLASIRLQQGRQDEAEDLLRHGLDLGADCFECHYNLGNLYWSRDAFAQAQTHFVSAVRLRPGDSDARYNLAITDLALEDFDGALPLLEELSTERPDNAIIWRELGRVYALRGRLADSEAAYARAAALGQ